MDLYFLLVVFFLTREPDVHIYAMPDVDSCVIERNSYNNWAPGQAYAECITKHVDLPASTGGNTAPDSRRAK